MNEPHWDHLIHGYLDDSLTESELAEFESLMFESASARRRFWGLAEVHGLARESARLAWRPGEADAPDGTARRGDWFLEAALPEALRTSPVLNLAEKMDPVAPTRWTGWLSGRPLTAAAASFLFGLFSATMVWAYAVNQRSVVVLHEGFETSPGIVREIFPESVGRWTAVGASVVGTEGDVSPKGGASMLRLEPRAKEKSTRMYYVVDLRSFAHLTPGLRQEFELRTSFHPAIPGKTDNYILRAAAFADDLSSIDRHWMLDEWGDIQDHSLARAARSLKVSPGESKWESLSLTIDVPPGARILVLSVWAATLEEKAEDRAAHYVDDIRLSYFTHEPLP